MSLDVLPPIESSPLLDRSSVEYARLAREARQRVIETARVVDFDGLVTGRNSTPSATRSWIARRREDGRLVTVEHQGNLLIPLYQLDEVFDLHEHAATINQDLHRRGVGPWGIWTWWETQNGWVGERPSRLRDEPARLLTAIEGTFDNEA